MADGEQRLAVGVVDDHEVAREERGFARELEPGLESRCVEIGAQLVAAEQVVARDRAQDARAMPEAVFEVLRVGPFDEVDEDLVVAADRDLQVGDASILGELERDAARAGAGTGARGRDEAGAGAGRGVVRERPGERERVGSHAAGSPDGGLRPRAA